MNSAHVYIIPATDKPTRNPNKMSDELPPQGRLVANSRKIHRAKNSGAILIVPFHPTEGRPMFDNENPAHQMAAAAYEMSIIETTIARARLTVDHKTDDLARANKAIEEAEATKETAENELEQAQSALAELEALHGKEDNTSSGDNKPDLKALVQSAIGELEDGNEDHWTTSGKPEVKAINAILSKTDGDNGELKVSAAQRDAIWEEMQKESSAD